MVFKCPSANPLSAPACIPGRSLWSLRHSTVLFIVLLRRSAGACKILPAEPNGIHFLFSIAWKIRTGPKPFLMILYHNTFCSKSKEPFFTGFLQSRRPVFHPGSWQYSPPPHSGLFPGPQPVRHTNSPPPLPSPSGLTANASVFSGIWF